MKKLQGLLLVLVALLLTTGCGNKVMTCTMKETDDDGYTTESTRKITSKNDEVIKIEETTVAEADKETIDSILSFSEEALKAFNEIDGMEVKFEKVNDTKYKQTMKIDYDKINLDDLSGLFGESSETKKQTLDELINEAKEEGYTCK